MLLFNFYILIEILAVAFQFTSKLARIDAVPITGPTATITALASIVLIVVLKDLFQFGMILNHLKPDDTRAHTSIDMTAVIATMGFARFKAFDDFVINPLHFSVCQHNRDTFRMKRVRHDTTGFRPSPTDQVAKESGKCRRQNVCPPYYSTFRQKVKKKFQAFVNLAARYWPRSKHPL